MEPNQSTNQNSKKIKPELILALTAVLISFSTLFVYLYQSKLMATQQKMAVWPHITFGPSWGNDYLTINMMNKGVGPALIGKVDIKMNNESIAGIHEIMKAIPDSLQSPFNYSSLTAGEVVMSGEKIQLFHISHPETIAYFLALMEAGKINIEVCYCSIYNDCWTSNGIEVEDSKCR